MFFQDNTKLVSFGEEIYLHAPTTVQSYAAFRIEHY